MREDLKIRLERFREQNAVDEAVRGRIVRPAVEFIGDEILEQAVSALLQGENLLLCGGKATGKNILADNLAWLFGRPVYNVSFHVNTDSSTLIGTDTFVGGRGTAAPGPGGPDGPVRGLLHPGRDQHGQERRRGGDALGAGLPPAHRCAGL